jgi:toxin ParE1/3/4
MDGGKQLVWSADADNDLISIWRNGAEAWSDGAADKRLFEIEYACERLLDEPMLGKERDELIVGMRSIPAHPHIIFYRISKSVIEIVRVLHQRIDIEKVFQDA